MIKILAALLITSLIISCDCMHHVHGNIYEEKTGEQLAGVTITRYHKRKPLVDSINGAVISRRDGGFDFTAMSTGLLCCSKIKLVFQKTGYQSITKTYRSCCTNADTIFLKK